MTILSDHDERVPSIHYTNSAIVIELGVNGLGVVRSLGTLGIDVIGIYTEEGAGCFSKYCRPIEFPRIAGDEDGFKKKLIELCSSLKKPPVLFPTSDQSVSFISRHREELADIALFSLPDSDTLDKIINKDGTFELASCRGVPIPATHVPVTMDDIRSVAETINFPVIFKPNDTFSGLLPGNAKNLTFRTKPEMLEFFEANPACSDKGVLQEIIWGGDGYIYVCAGYFNKTGDALTLYTGRKIRQHLPDYGVTCCGESVDVPEIRQISVDFMKKLNYWGLASVEFTRDRKTGKFYFLEINARSYYHNSLFLSCGINLPYTAYLDMVSGGTAAIQPSKQKEGIIWIDFLRDVGSFWRKFKKGELGFFEWLATVRKASSYGVYDPEDTGPFRYNTLQLMRVFFRKIVGG